VSTKAPVKTQAKTSAAAARIPQPTAAVPEHEAERPDIAAQLEGAARLGHSLGAVSVDSSAPPIIQRQGLPEEEEEELQMKREPAALQRQEQPEEEEELMMKRDIQRVGPQGGPVPPEVEAAIRRARGGGQPLEGALREQMSASLGHDFSRVRVHTGPEADDLNQQLQAKAFTTGPDIFFRQGAYDPSSGGGRELIAHELSHVVQQGTGRVSGGGSGMTVRPAGDAFEQEADAVSTAAPSRVRPKSNPDAARADARPIWSSPADILDLRGVWSRASVSFMKNIGRGRDGMSNEGHEHQAGINGVVQRVGVGGNVNEAEHMAGQPMCNQAVGIALRAAGLIEQDTYDNIFSATEATRDAVKAAGTVIGPEGWAAVRNIPENDVIYITRVLPTGNELGMHVMLSDGGGFAYGRNNSMIEQNAIAWARYNLFERGPQNWEPINLRVYHASIRG
jgi:hypothetical protein